jgi:hypothetical protein
MFRKITRQKKANNIQSAGFASGDVFFLRDMFFGIVNNIGQIVIRKLSSKVT